MLLILILGSESDGLVELDTREIKAIPFHYNFLLVLMNQQKIIDSDIKHLMFWGIILSAY